MKPQIIKAVKILLIILVGIIILAVAGFFVMGGTRTSTQTAGYGPGVSFDYNMSDSLGLGAAMEESTFFRTKSANYNAPMDGGGNTDSDYNQGDLTTKKIIKNGSLTLYVKDAEGAAAQIREVAISAGGFTSQSNIYKSSSGSKSGNVVIRVPASNFETVMHNVKQLAEEVERENTTSRDVTEEYVDLEAQIRNLRSEETQYLEIMRKSYTIADTLKVASRLSDVRGRIERAQGRLQFLSRQVDMSTISITLSADDDIKVFGLRWRPLVVLKRSFKSMLTGLTDYADKMTAFILLLPVIILWVATILGIIYVVYRIGRYLFRKLFRPRREE